MTEHEFERFWREHRLPRQAAEDVWIQRVAGAVVALGLLLAVYAVLVLTGHLPPAPWSQLA